MKAPRHGCRTSILSLALIAALGCGQGDSPPLASIPKPDARRARPPEDAPRTLEAPERASAVSEIAWSGDRLAVRHSDGRFVVHRIGGGDGPPRSMPPAGAAPIRAIALVGDRVVTGDDRGLTAWDVGRGTASAVVRLDCGPVSALVADPADPRESSLWAAVGTGRLLRVAVRRGDRIEVLAERPAAEIVRLVAMPGRGVAALGADGRAWLFDASVSGPSAGFGRARAMAVSRAGVVARLIDGPRVTLDRPRADGAPSRFDPPRPAGAVALAEGGRSLIVAGESCAWVVPIDESGGIRPGAAREVRGLRGSPIVATEPGGGRVAIGDGSGAVLLLHPRDLAARGEPIPLDDLPEWAFRPWLRFGTPRPGDDSAPADPRLESIRDLLARGEVGKLAGEVRALDGAPDLDRRLAGEVQALAAAIEGRDGSASPPVLRRLAAAAEAFGREGRADREADMEFWRGVLLTRGLLNAAGAGDRSSPEAIGPLRRAAVLYRGSKEGLGRQARLCDVARAWVLRETGDLRGAIALQESASRGAEADPVLAQVVELDRANAALAEARGDWPRAADAHGRILARLASGERPDLRREAALGRAGALMALGTPRPAAAALEADVPSDPEWTIRRASCRRAAGLAVASPKRAREDDPVAAHVRALTAEGVPDADRLSDWRTAIDGHRRAGRDDLATEATLALAEDLERLGRVAEAGSLFAEAERAASAIDDADGRRAARPLGFAGRRAARGMARAAVAPGRTGRMIAALDRLGRADGAEGPIPALGLTGEEFALAEALRDARARLEALGGPGSGPEAASAAVEVHRLRTDLAGHGRSRPAHEEDADPAALGLADDEAVLTIESIGPRALAGVFQRGRGEPRAGVLPVTGPALRDLASAWRAKAGDGGRPFAASEERSPLEILGLGPEPDPPIPQSVARPRGPVESRLYEALLAPFSGGLEGLSRLHVVPGGGLAAMPLEVLARDARFGGRTAVRLLPGRAMLSALRSEARPARPTDSRVLRVSADDGASPRERSWAADVRAAGWTPEGLFGPEARRSRLLGDPLTRYAALHIAATAAPGPSGEPGFRLRPAGLAGTITAADLASIPLRARVIVLEIDAPRGLAPEAVRDLARSALEAGADSAVLALWTHPDASSRVFFSSFYRSLAGGKTAAESAEVARSAVAREPAFRDAVHWAGYAVYGL